jgi:signal transduction histidine kinase
MPALSPSPRVTVRSGVLPSGRDIAFALWRSWPLVWALLSGAVVLTVGLTTGLVDELQFAQGGAEAAGAYGCLLTARHTVGRARLAWMLFASGLLIWAVTDISSGIASLAGTAVLDSVSWFDAAWLSFYVPMFVGVGLVYTGLRPERGWQGLLDGLLLVVAISTAGWLWFVVPAVHASEAGVVESAVNALYPALDLAAIASLGWLLLRHGAASPGWLRLVAAAFGLQAVADLAFLLSSAEGLWAEALSASTFTAAGGIWLFAAHRRRRLPERVWQPDRLSAPPLWSGAIPVALCIGLVAVSVHRPGRGVALVALLGVMLMGLRSLLSLALERRLADERREVHEARARLLAREQAAREATEKARALVENQNLRLREIDRMKDEFVAMVSHEFRTPLTSIRNYLYPVRDQELGPLGEEQRRFLSVVDRNAERLARLVEDLLLFARIQDGKATLERRPTDIAALVAECAESAEPHARSAGVRLHTTAPPKLVTSIDPGRIGQVLDNLISNAIKFSPPDARVTIDVEDHSSRVTIRVADEGPGIHPAELPRLFTPFHRTRAAIREAVPGTGLGLTISKNLVEAHGGTIAARSALGEGTVLTVTLPRTSGDSDVDEETK